MPCQDRQNDVGLQRAKGVVTPILFEYLLNLFEHSEKPSTNIPVLYERLYFGVKANVMYKNGVISTKVGA